MKTKTVPMGWQSSRTEGAWDPQWQCEELPCQLSLLICKNYQKENEILVYLNHCVFFVSLWQQPITYLNQCKCQPFSSESKMSQISSPKANSSLPTYFAWLAQYSFFFLHMDVFKLDMNLKMCHTPQQSLLYFIYVMIYKAPIGTQICDAC